VQVLLGLTEAPIILSQGKLSERIPSIGGFSPQIGA